MTIKSMTGFARSDGAHGDVTWHWEVRSVNGRSLDIRQRLAPGYEALEPKVREIVGARLTRGSVNVVLTVQRQSGGPEIKLNEQVLAQVLAAAERVRQATGGEPPRIDGVLALKGVLEIAERTESEAESAERLQAMAHGFVTAVENLVSSRSAEGSRLSLALAGQLDEIERLVAFVRTAPQRSTEAIKLRLAEQVAKLVDASQGLDPARLHQEAVLIATRADVAEELERLGSHIAAARDLLGDGAAVGRKFDFLAQEFNREANTLCSKSNDVEITRAGLALKVLVDQMREQVQNIE